MLDTWLNEAGITIDNETGLVVTNGSLGLILQELDPSFNQEAFTSWWND